MLMHCKKCLKISTESTTGDTAYPNGIDGRRIGNALDIASICI